MRKFLLSCIALAMVFTFGACKKEQSPRDAAEQYYGYLIKGDVDKYMQGIANYKNLPEEYRKQLNDLFLQYLDHEKEVRGGMVAVHAVRDTLIDSLNAQVFVEITYGDKTSEEVSMPLVLTDEGWRMK